ncbi:uncharacterized transporter slc-17.2 [Aplysia californica]|uniref:Uncharacterized transporter slc-17.2 n=1 Tax=Aplysia californica TaxID=6500 RepID=A0ABM0ZWW1_APLCA|nr:uncharacterized transporter slc-17.2 [Aplysia californica]
MVRHVDDDGLGVSENLLNHANVTQHPLPEHGSEVNGSRLHHDPGANDVPTGSIKLQNNGYPKSHEGKTNSHKVVDKGPPRWRSQRYILAYFLLGGMMNIFFQRTNFSIAIICMVNHTAVAQLGRGRLHHNNNNTSLHELTGSPNNASNNTSRAHLLNLFHNQAGFGALNNNSSSVSSSTKNSSFLDYSLSSSNVTTFLSSGGGSGGDGDGDRSIRGGGFPYMMRNVSGDILRGVTTWKYNKDDSGERVDSGSGGGGGSGGGEDTCASRGAGGGEEKEDGPFVWDKTTQGLLLGALFWTYLLLTFPGYHLVRNRQKRHVIMVSMLVMSVTSLLIHGAALLSPWAVFVIKLIHGACTALTVIAFYGMWARWAPPSERASLLSLYNSGQMIANIAAFPTSALLCKYGFFGGWPSVFYVFGIIGIVWVVLFFFFTAETPEKQKFITEGEKLYITSSLPAASQSRAVKVPYGAIMTSPAVWALVCAQFSFTWGLFLFLSTLPQYMNEVLKFDVKSNGVFSMLPYIALMLVVQVSGPIADVLVKRRYLRVPWTRKLYLIIGNFTPAVILIALSFLDCTQSGLAIVLLTVAVGFSGFNMTGWLVYPYDIAPPYAPQIMAIGNSFACVPGILTPYVVAAITVDQTREQWQMVFFLTAGVLIAGALGFCILGTGNVQPWALRPVEDHVIKMIDLSRDQDETGVDENGCGKEGREKEGLDRSEEKDVDV